MRRKAVFLDRDGTLNVDLGYITRSEQLQLLPGVGPALRRLMAADFALVLVTNQSVVGRGLMTEVDLHAVHAELTRLLAASQVALDGIYYCPHAPRSSDALAYEHPDRKPAPGMLVRAAADLQLDLARSWMIGDAVRDVLAGQNAGCRGSILVRTGGKIEEAQFAAAQPFPVLDDMQTAVEHILNQAEDELS